MGIALLLLPFTGWLAVVIERLLPDRQSSDTVATIKAVSLPQTLVRTSPGMDIAAVRPEVCRIGRFIQADTQKDIGHTMIPGDEQKLQRIVERDHDVNRLYRKLVSIIPRISQEKRLHEKRSPESCLSQDRIRLYAVETDLIARMRSCANYPRKIAKAVLDF